MFAKRRYQRALRGDANSLSLRVLKTAGPTGFDARLMVASPIAAAVLGEWPIEDLTDGATSYKDVTADAAREALHVLAWWLVCGAERIVSGDPDRGLAAADALIPIMHAGREILNVAVPATDVTGPAILAVCVTLTGEEPVPWSPSMVLADYMVASALGQAVDERRGA